MVQAAAVNRRDAWRFLQALRLQNKIGASLVIADVPWSPTMGLLLGSALPQSCAVAAWEGRRAVALAQTARHYGRDQWELMHLVVAGLEQAAGLETDTGPRRMLTLLDEVCRVAGSKRITSIVTRVPAESGLVALFRQAGFSVAMSEHTYAQSPPFDSTETSVPGLRLQEQRDAWPLYELYLRCTPESVRIAEGRTAREWQMRRNSSRFSFQATRWVADGEEGLSGWLTESPGRNGAWRVQIGVEPGNPELARNLLATTLQHAAEARSSSLWSRVPDHATEVNQAFVDGGFVEIGHSLVLRRSLAIRARVALPERAKRGVARGSLTAAQSQSLKANRQPIHTQ